MTASPSIASCGVQHLITYPSLGTTLGYLSMEVGPPVVHDLRLTMECDDTCRECAGAGCHPIPVIARILVNEFPLHFFRDTDSWFWRFDMCPCGPSEPLGAMVDELLVAGRIWNGEEPSTGAVLHLQQLELNPAGQREHAEAYEALVPDLVRTALWLLSRSPKDLAVAETRPIAAPRPSLWPMEMDRFTELTALLERGLVTAGFRAHGASPNHTVDAGVRERFDMSAEEDGVSYYKRVRKDASFFGHIHESF